MGSLQEFIEPAARIAVQGLINCLWQGAVIASLAWVLMCAIKRANAPTRYAIWWVVLLAILLTAALTSQVAPLDAETSRADADIYESAAQPLSHVAIDGHAPIIPLTGPRPSDPQDISSLEETSAESLIFSIEFIQGRLLMAIFFAWIAGVIWKLIQLAHSFAYLQRIKREGEAASATLQLRFEKWLKTCGESRPVQLMVSDRVSTPMAAGFASPAVILPATLAESLTEAEFDQVVLHELAHIRRRDDWAKLAQKIIESFLFFHPAALWTGERLNLEREIACDDRVVSVTGESKPYAACLIKLVETAGLRPGSMLAPGVVMRKKQITRRIEMLLDKKRDATLRTSIAGLIMSVVALSLAVTVGARVSPVIALSEQAALAMEIPASHPAREANDRRASATPARSVSASKAEAEPARPYSIQQETQPSAPRSPQQLQEPNPPTPPPLPKMLPVVPHAAPSPPALPAGTSHAEMSRYQRQMEQYEQAMKLYEEQMKQYEQAMSLYNEQMGAYNEQMREYEKMIRQYEKEMQEFEKQVYNLVPGVVLQLFKQEINNVKADSQTRAGLYKAAEHASPVIARELIANLRDLKINRPEGFIMIVSELSTNSIASKIRNVLDDARDSRAIELDGDSLAKLRQVIERISPSLQRLVVHRFR